MIERDEDTFVALRNMAEDLDLLSRNYNDEVIGIDYYNNLAILTEEELNILERLWFEKTKTCQKEKFASLWMVFQIWIFTGCAVFIAWQSSSLLGVLVGIAGIVALISIVDDKRLRLAKRNLADARRVHATLIAQMKSNNQSKA